MSAPWKVLASVALIAGLLSPSVDGNNKLFNSSRVVGGNTTSIRNFPFMVSMKKSGFHHFCGGSILSPSAVLTAAHCLDKKEPREVVVVAGIDGMDYKKGQVRRCVKFEIHPGYNNRQHFINDAGVIILEKPFRYNPVVQPLRFLTYDTGEAETLLLEMKRTHAHCMSPGWGLTVPDVPLASKVLKVTPATLLTSKECGDRLNRYFKEDDHLDFDGMHEVCVTSGYGRGCKGDSGGPLVCNGKVIGVVSYSAKPDEPRFLCSLIVPEIYTDLVPILQIALKYI